ncbi:hypothetical protein ACIBG6_07275 [Streptomyces sp. NPDC050842]|uniref:hypothetical protein n=1 Tax=Streptomyces sp. NPDC050842 TaxID=3365636 RepID=UPI0037A25061
MPYANPDGTTGTDLYLQADKFRAAFVADVPLPTTRLMHFHQRAGARRVVEVPGASHVPMISHPGITARLIGDAAEATG